MPTLIENQLAAELFREAITSPDPGMFKAAVDEATNFVRLKNRSGGFREVILPSEKVENSELTPQYDTLLPCKVYEMEVDSPAATTLPFGTLPTKHQLFGERFRVMMSRVVSRFYQADIDTIRTSISDLRQIVSDNTTKDMLTEQDAGLVMAVNDILVGPEQVCPFSGVVQWRQFASSISRDSLIDSESIMLRTQGRFTPKSMLVNAVTWKEFEKIPFNEFGGGGSEEMFTKGWTSGEFRGMKFVSTLYDNIVPDNTIFHFADPIALGRACRLYDPVMYVKQEAFFLEYFMYMCGGAVIANPYAVTRTDFAA